MEGKQSAVEHRLVNRYNDLRHSRSRNGNHRPRQRKPTVALQRESKVSSSTSDQVTHCDVSDQTQDSGQLKATHAEFIYQSLMRSNRDDLHHICCHSDDGSHHELNLSQGDQCVEKDCPRADLFGCNSQGDDPAVYDNLGTDTSANLKPEMITSSAVFIPEIETSAVVTCTAEMETSTAFSQNTATSSAKATDSLTTSARCNPKTNTSASCILDLDSSASCNSDTDSSTTSGYPKTDSSTTSNSGTDSSNSCYTERLTSARCNSEIDISSGYYPDNDTSTSYNSESGIPFCNNSDIEQPPLGY